MICLQVDLRYSTIADETFDIYIKLNAIYIATVCCINISLFHGRVQTLKNIPTMPCTPRLLSSQTPDESRWTEDNRLGYYTEAYDSLDDFELWLTTARDGLPPFDLATLFSG